MKKVVAYLDISQEGNTILSGYTLDTDEKVVASNTPDKYVTTEVGYLTPVEAEMGKFDRVPVTGNFVVAKRPTGKPVDTVIEALYKLMQKYSDYDGIHINYLTSELYAVFIFLKDGDTYSGMKRKDTSASDETIEAIRKWIKEEKLSIYASTVIDHVITAYHAFFKNYLIEYNEDVVFDYRGNGYWKKDKIDLSMFYGAYLVIEPNKYEEGIAYCANIKEPLYIGRQMSNVTLTVGNMKLPPIVDFLVQEFNKFKGENKNPYTINTRILSLQLPNILMRDFKERSFRRIKQNAGFSYKFVMLHEDLSPVYTISPPGLIYEALNAMNKAYEMTHNPDNYGEDITDLFYTDKGKVKPDIPMGKGFYIMAPYKHLKNIPIELGEDTVTRNHFKRYEKLHPKVYLYAEEYEKSMHYYTRIVTDTFDCVVYGPTSSVIVIKKLKK